MLPLLLLLSLAGQPEPVRVDECSKPALTLALRATAGVQTGIADLDAPRLSMLEPEAKRAEAVAARNERVKRLVEVVLLACQQEAQAAQQPKPEPSPAPSPEEKK
jgi:hypothetical protein